MTGHKNRKVFDGYYEIYDEDLKHLNDDLFSEVVNGDKPKMDPDYKLTNTPPIPKEKEEEIEKLKYSLDKGWINQKKYDELFQELLFG